jgi:hypothetical protein
VRERERFLLKMGESWVIYRREKMKMHGME